MTWLRGSGGRGVIEGGWGKVWWLQGRTEGSSSNVRWRYHPSEEIPHGNPDKGIPDCRENDWRNGWKGLRDRYDQDQNFP